MHISAHRAIRGYYLEKIQNMLKKWLSKNNTKSEDFSNFFGDVKLTKKEYLIEQCKKNNVSIHIDDASETSTGVYAELRGVASEAELENRLNSKTALSKA